MIATPQLEHIEQVSDGWVKKYVLTYRMPDGTQHVYESASRKNLPAYRALLEENARHCRTLAAPPNESANETAEPQPAQSSTSVDAVSIVGRTKRDTLLMIREFRYPLNSWCIAFPAGLIDTGESLRACANRELREETGYALLEDSPLEVLPQAGYSSTGLTDETVQIVFAQIERVYEAQPERNELIEAFELPVADVPRFLKENQLPIGTRAQLVLEAFARRR